MKLCHLFLFFLTFTFLSSAYSLNKNKGKPMNVSDSGFAYVTDEGGLVGVTDFWIVPDSEKKNADSPHRIHIRLEDEDFPFYKELLGKFNKDENKPVTSIKKLKKKVADLRRESEMKKLPSKPPGAEMPESVGTATMGQDGVIKMQFRSVDHGMIAEALKVVKPTDSDYQSIIKHLGGIKPGESKKIPPFPEP